ncbi:MAG: hypothetical protein IJL17_03255 [Kiritimatiellae bacterium]|nr:hypothetical protein [Kiritimatiellia bacterium]
MEINLSNNIGVRQNMDGFQVGSPATQVEHAAATDTRQPASELRLSTFDPVKGSEPTAEVPESALMRDDELGKLVGAAFNLAAPPMPTFTE